MSEAYLFASALAPAPDDALQDLLRKSGARPAWLAEAHWLGQPVPNPPDGKPFYPWPDHPLLPLFALQSLLRALECGAADLILIGQSAPPDAAALLLGSPAAVGRWNLAPAARLRPLACHAAHPEAFLPAALRSAEALLPEEARIALASVCGLPATGLPPGPEWRELPGPELARVARLAAGLIETGQEFALLAEFSARGGLAFLLERI